jgi:uncharacterized protein YacL
MNIALNLVRILFITMSIVLLSTSLMSQSAGSLLSNTLGLSVGSLFALLLIGIDFALRKYKLQMVNLVFLGLFIGFIMGQIFLLIFNSFSSSLLYLGLTHANLEIVKMCLIMLGTYIGTIMTIRANEKIAFSLPFVKLCLRSDKKKDLLLDSSILGDARIIDLAASGLVDSHLIVPRFIIKDLYAQMESPDEMIRTRAKKSLESLKKIEEISDVEIRYTDTDFPEIQDIMGKLIKLARQMDANIISSDISRVQTAALEGIKIINLNSLSNALKPLMEAGEQIKIKIQRYGKEPRQGVGYLEDGTMVVVNGGGDFIGENIDAYVLSVKHTSSGRMIFCNAVEEQELVYPGNSNA